MASATIGTIRGRRPPWRRCPPPRPAAVPVWARARYVLHQPTLAFGSPGDERLSITVARIRLHL